MPKTLRSPARADFFARLAWWMDNAIPVPGTRMRVGIDAIVGLLPGAGDVIITAVQATFILCAVALTPGMPMSLVARMVANLIIDCAVGTIPLFGDVFDAFFKANTRNLRLLEKARAEQASRGRVRGWTHVAYLAAIATTLIAVLGGLALGTFFLLEWTYRYLIKYL